MSGAPRLGEQGQGVEYRQGLPSVEDVRAHQQRVPLCTWQIRYPDREGAWPERRQLVAIEPGTVTNGRKHDVACVGMPCELLGGVVLPVADNAEERTEWRPCLPDGTPCAWPGAAPAAQQAPAVPVLKCYRIDDGDVIAHMAARHGGEALGIYCELQGGDCDSDEFTVSLVPDEKVRDGKKILDSEDDERPDGYTLREALDKARRDGKPQLLCTTEF